MLGTKIDLGKCDVCGKKIKKIVRMIGSQRRSPCMHLEKLIEYENLTDKEIERFKA